MSREPVTASLAGGDLSSVVALHGGALGDLVLTHHVLARVRRRFPTVRIEAVTRSPLARWMAGPGVIAAAPDNETFGISQLFTEPDETPAPVTGQLRGRGSPAPPADADARKTLADRLRAYDLILNFMGADGAPPAPALQRAGLNAICVDPTPAAETIRSRRHITEQWMDALAAKGLPLSGCTAVELQIRKEERRAAGARQASARSGRAARA